LTGRAEGLCGENYFNASSRCDYATMVGTLRFNAVETTKTIHIPLVDDSPNGRLPHDD
jgi:hypothetical protein